MKISHVLNAYLPEQIAGTEVYVAALARELKKQQVDSVVIIPNYGSAKNERYFFEDIEIIKYAEPTIAIRDVITGEIAPNGLCNFLKVLDEEKPHIVHFHELAGSIGIGLFHVEATKAAGFKTIMTFHLAKYTCRTGTLMYMNEVKCDGVIKPLKCSRCWLNDKEQRGIKTSLIEAGFRITNFLNIDTRFIKNGIGTALAFPQIIKDIKKNLLLLQKHIDKFIVLTEWYKDILIKNGIEGDCTSLIYQGIPNISEVKFFLKSNKKLRVVFIGRISHFKGVDILIKALQKLPVHEIELDIYGAAIEEGYLQKCLQLADGMDNVFWKGSINPENVIETIKDYDILCIPSAVSEMGPFVLKEAFAAGVPVLASDVYGNAEQITHNENGWLFKFKNVDDLRLKLEMLLKDKSAISKAARNIKPVRNFEMVAAEHKIVYQKVISSS
jgi:glycosyltransferase involved in cell wall biosynthesis